MNPADQLVYVVQKSIGRARARVYWINSKGVLRSINVDAQNGMSVQMIKLAIVLKSHLSHKSCCLGHLSQYRTKAPLIIPPWKLKEVPNLQKEPSTKNLQMIISFVVQSFDWRRIINLSYILFIRCIFGISSVNFPL